MTKQEFLHNDHVLHLIDHLCRLWQGGFDFNLNRGRGDQLDIAQVPGLRHAFELYQWGPAPDNLFHHSAAILENAQRMLRQGMEDVNEEMVRDASATVLRWGGVFKKGNRDRVENRGYDLMGQYRLVQVRWDRLDNNQLQIDDQDPGFVSNSGFTKIYSLLLDNFIIYDSRVSVALAYLIDSFYQNGHIPHVLRLYIPPSAVGNPLKRSVNPFFRKTNQSNGKHFYSNVTISWLLSAIRDKLQQSGIHVQLREIEAALFMVGYDVRNMAWQLA